MGLKSLSQSALVAMSHVNLPLCVVSGRGTHTDYRVHSLKESGSIFRKAEENPNIVFVKLVVVNRVQGLVVRYIGSQLIDEI